MSEAVNVKSGLPRPPVRDANAAEDGTQSNLLATCRLIGFLLTILLMGSVIVYGISIPLLAFGFIWPPACRAAERVLARAIRAMLRTQPWVDARISMPLGRLPDNRAGGQLFVSNHRSYLDVVFLLGQVPGLRFLSRRSIFRVPFLGLMMRLTRQVPATSGCAGSFQQAIEKIRRLLRAGERVHVFPELTRCQPGLCGTLAFALAPFQLAFQERVLVVPVAIRGTDDAWPKGFFGIRPGAKIELQMLEPVNPAGFASAVALRDAVRERINEALKS